MNWRVAVLSIVLMLAAQPAINLIADINSKMSLPAFMSDIETWMQQMEEANKQTTEALMATTSIGGVLANVLVIGLLAAMSEELLFRGALQGLFGRRLEYPNYSTPHAAIWVTAILFSLMHLQFYGFIPRMLMGALFGYVLAWTGSLWVPILMHFVNNGSVVIVYAIMHHRGVDMDALETMGTGSTWWLGVISLIVVCTLIYLLKKNKDYGEVYL